VAEGIRGDGVAAEEALRRAIRLDPRNVFALVALGKVLEARGARHEAILRFQAALEVSDERVEALDPLLRMLIDEGRLAEAETLAVQAGKRFPQLATPYHYLGRVRWAQRRPQEAEQLLQRAAALDPTSHLVFLDLGRLERELGRDERARAALEQAHRNLSSARPQDAEETFYQLIQVVAPTDPQRALELAREYLRTFPAHPRAQATLRQLEGGEGG
jgi:tetratricopeptide (TPR) repeat protein